MPIVIICRCDICPSAASQGSEEAHEGDEGGELVAGPAREEIPKTDEGESRTCMHPSVTREWRMIPGSRTSRNGNKYHKEGALGVAIANGGRHRREPFLRVAVKLILDDLVIVQVDANDQGAQEGS